MLTTVYTITLFHHVVERQFRRRAITSPVTSNYSTAGIISAGRRQWEPDQSRSQQGSPEVVTCITEQPAPASDDVQLMKVLMDGKLHIDAYDSPHCASQKIFCRTVN